MNAEEIRVLVMCYWRFQRGQYFVASEFNYGDADVISVSKKGRMVYETEVKISIADMKREKYKSKHFGMAQWWGSGTSHFWADFFYFAVPSAIQDKAVEVCRDLFPYAGLLVVDDYEQYLEHNERPYTNPPIREIKEPKKLPAKPLDEEGIFRIAKGMSNSFCGRAYELMRLKHDGIEDLIRKGEREKVAFDLQIIRDTSISTTQFCGMLDKEIAKLKGEPNNSKRGQE